MTEQELKLKWAAPTLVTDVALAFPVGVEGTLMPDYKDIPKEFREPSSNNKWIRMQKDWFFGGLKNSKFTPKNGIKTEDALRHLSAIQRSFQPKHEHKQAAVAFLASLWFEDVTYEGGEVR